MTSTEVGGGPVTTVVLVDDHSLFREGVREIFEAQPDLKVVGEAQDSLSAIEVVSEAQPDVVLLDVGIPGAPVTSTVSRIHASSPRSRVIILSMYDGPALVRALLTRSIYGFLLKSVTRHELTAVVGGARRGGDRCVLLISRESAQRLGAAPEPPPPVPAEEAGGVVLTMREREVLTLVGQAMSNAKIAKRLSLSEGTVKRHLRNVFGKLNARSRMDAVNKAVAAGLIDRQAVNS